MCVDTYLKNLLRSDTSIIQRILSSSLQQDPSTLWLVCKRVLLVAAVMANIIPEKKIWPQLLAENAFEKESSSLKGGNVTTTVSPTDFMRGKKGLFSISKSPDIYAVPPSSLILDLISVVVDIVSASLSALNAVESATLVDANPTTTVCSIIRLWRDVIAISGHRLVEDANKHTAPASEDCVSAAFMSGSSGGGGSHGESQQGGTHTVLTLDVEAGDGAEPHLVLTSASDIAADVCRKILLAALKVSGRPHNIYISHFSNFLI